MRILLLGSGGREHALCWKLAQSESVEKIFVAPGNPGTAATRRSQNVPIPSDDLDALVGFASTEGIDLTIVGPEKPLADGVTDRFDERDLAVFGPSRYTAQLEASKRFAKELMAECKVPTATFETLTSVDAARSYVRSTPYPLVLKADGLAAGKGVKVCTQREDAEEFIQAVMENRKFGTAGSTIVAEEFLEGEEASFLVVANGTEYVPLAGAQDHKLLEEGDQGPNTGGMGAYSPAPVFNATIQTQTEKEIVQPILSTLAKRGQPFLGVLYVGLMISPAGPKVLEFNVRFGDPEAQAVLPRLDSDLAELLHMATRGKLSHAKATWKKDHALTVVLAANGYPAAPEKGKKITGIPEGERDALVFHAGTKSQNGDLLTSGGRVMAVTGMGGTLQQARENAYRVANQITFDGKVLRRDIGWRAL